MTFDLFSKYDSFFALYKMKLEETDQLAIMVILTIYYYEGLITLYCVTIEHQLFLMTLV